MMTSPSTKRKYKSKKSSNNDVLVTPITFGETEADEELMAVREDVSNVSKYTETLEEKAPVGEKTAIRRPGRPPKQKTPNTQYKIAGVVSKPVFSDNVLEMVCEDPPLFKKLATFFKGFGTDEIHWKFYTDKVEININDHQKLSTVFVTIHGNQILRYYCQEPISVCIKRSNFDCITDVLGKQHTQIVFALKNESKNSMMFAQIHQGEVHADRTYEIPLIDSIDVMGIEHADVSSYPLQFSLANSFFKQVFDTLHKYNVEKLVMEKSSQESPLMFIYEGGGGPKTTDTFQNDKTISLKYIPESEDSIFSAVIAVMQIRPFSKSSIGGDSKISIAADMFKPFYLKTEIQSKNNTSGSEPLCLIEMYTNINDVGI